MCVAGELAVDANLDAVGGAGANADGTGVAAGVFVGLAVAVIVDGVAGFFGGLAGLGVAGELTVDADLGSIGGAQAEADHTCAAGGVFVGLAVAVVIDAVALFVGWLARPPAPPDTLSFAGAFTVVAGFDCVGLTPAIGVAADASAVEGVDGGKWVGRIGALLAGILTVAVVDLARCENQHDTD